MLARREGVRMEQGPSPLMLCSAEESRKDGGIQKEWGWGTFLVA